MSPVRFSPGTATLAPTGTVDLAGGPVEYRWIPGGSSPIVLLHEGLGCVATWGRFPDVLAAATGRGVLAWSRHGYGGSAPVDLPRPPSYLHDEAAGPLPELLAACGIAAPVLVGHSDGATIALLHAAAAPVAALVLVAPHVVVEPETLAGIDDAAAEYADGPLAARLARVHDDPDAVFRGWSDVWRSPAFAGLDVTPDVARVDCPILLAQGTDDAFGTAAQLDRVAGAVRGPVRRWEPAGVGHHPHLEVGDALAAEIAAFLGVPHGAR